MAGGIELSGSAGPPAPRRGGNGDFESGLVGWWCMDEHLYSEDDTRLCDEGVRKRCRTEGSAALGKLWWYGQKLEQDHR